MTDFVTKNARMALAFSKYFTDNGLTWEKLEKIPPSDPPMPNADNPKGIEKFIESTLKPYWDKILSPEPRRKRGTSGIRQAQVTV